MDSFQGTLSLAIARGARCNSKGSSGASPSPPEFASLEVMGGVLLILLVEAS